MVYLMCLFVAAVIVFPWFIVSRTFEGLPNKQAKAKEKAIKMGHVIEASLSDIYTRTNGTEKDQHRENTCIYHYCVNGKRYQYTLFNDHPPKTLTLYYLNDPQKAGVEGDINVSGTSWILRYLIVLGIVVFLAKVLIK